MPYATLDGLKINYAVHGNAAGLWAGPEAGPWATMLRDDDAFAAKYVKQGLEQYLAIAAFSRDILFDDTMPSGATGEQLMAIKLPTFIMSGDDASHSTSSAHALRELIPGSVFSPLMPPQQNPASVTAWIRDSVAAAGNAG